MAEGSILLVFCWDFNTWNCVWTAEFQPSASVGTFRGRWRVDNIFASLLFWNEWWVLDDRAHFWSMYYSVVHVNYDWNVDWLLLYISLKMFGLLLLLLLLGHCNFNSPEICKTLFYSSSLSFLAMCCSFWNPGLIVYCLSLYEYCFSSCTG